VEGGTAQTLLARYVMYFLAEKLKWEYENTLALASLEVQEIGR
jgi:hypothetical protein